MYKHYIKRILDVIISTLLIILLFPLISLLCVVILIDIREWPIYSEWRAGFHERLFLILKLKTMKTNPSLPERYRITPMGAFLRKYSLDELPQLWNVLAGSMSLVGPRPLKVKYLPFYTSTEKLRHSVRPGITGLAQVSGRNYLGWNERLNYDVEYVRHLNFKLDLSLLLRTVLIVLKAENVSVLPEDAETELDEERSQLMS
ncbi:sugar transferase [Parabacteroides sp. FAFU027]|uniref:sugar transferase n=1 Tax=Parabacteroides sp. FAFU027 TaxID=2922715 RepID=UPI001FAF61F2|nr:sugar transferase [Parabacteroides sp. FAFU027]